MIGFFRSALVMLLLGAGVMVLLGGCRGAGSAAVQTPASDESEELLQSRTFEVESQIPQGEARAAAGQEEEVRLSTAFVERAFADYARRTNSKLTLFFQAQQRYHEARYGEALSLINRALEIEESADALAMKGLIFAGLRAEDLAIQYWQRAIALDPQVFERILLPRE